MVLEPYKKRSANMSGTVLLIILGVAATTSAILHLHSFSTTLAWVQVGVLTLSHCVLYGFSIHKFIKKVKQQVYTEVTESKRPLIN